MLPPENQLTRFVGWLGKEGGLSREAPLPFRMTEGPSRSREGVPPLNNLAARALRGPRHCGVGRWVKPMSGADRP